MYKIGRWDKARALFGGIFFAVSGLLFYSINLISHLTIFAIEEQYLQPFGMVSPIERYGAPFMTGGLYTIAFLYLNGKEDACRKHFSHWCSDRYMPYLVCFGLVFLLADHKMCYEGLIGYRSSVEEVMDGRAEIVSGAASEFLKELEKENVSECMADERGMRILYLRDGRT